MTMLALLIGDRALECPRCGGRDLHQGEVEVFTRLPDELQRGATRITKVDGAFGRLRNSHVVSDGHHANPSADRNGMRITFDCETCASSQPPVLLIYQHKGQMFINWEDRVREGAHAR